MTRSTEKLIHAALRDGCREHCDALIDELRRSSAENDRLHQINQSHEMKLSVRGYEIQIADLEAQRDALLEALRAMLEQFNYHTITGIVHDESAAIAKARAAIKAVEGENHAKNL